MGFMQRGFACGNRRGFAVKQKSPELVLWLISFAGKLLGGGGKVQDRTEQLLSFEMVSGLGSYPDALSYYLGVDLTTFQQVSSGGGGKAADRTETVFTATAVLSLGSYP